MVLASVYTAAVASFLLGCLVAALWRGILDFAERQYADAANEPFGDVTYGDHPFIATDNLKSLLHNGEGNNQ